MPIRHQSQTRETPDSQQRPEPTRAFEGRERSGVGTDRNERILKLYDEGLSYDAIGAALGISRNAVAGVINRAGAKNRGGQKLDFVDYTGRVYGKLTVVRFVDRDINGHTRWHCVCVCGNTKEVQSSNLTSGKTKSCGCHLVALNAKRDKRRQKLTKDIHWLKGLGWDARSIAQALGVARSTIYVHWRSEP